MPWRSRTGTLLAVGVLAFGSLLQAVDIWTVGVNNTRQGWNRFETVLTAANVPKLRKIREFIVDEKIDVSPLVVGDKLYVFTMTNTAFVFDVNTGAQLAHAATRAAVRPGRHRQPAGLGMDRHNIYRKLGHHGDAGDRRRHEHALRDDVRQAQCRQPEHRAQQHAVDPRRQHARGQAAASADRGQCRQRRRRDRERLHHAVSEDARRPRTADRRGPATRRSSSRFSINGENPRGPGHGFVVAYDVRGLNREAGFTPTPAIWNVTPGGGAGGIWMSGSGPAIDGNDIYFATGNGMDPGTMPGNFGECFVKLRYTAGVAGVERRQADARGRRLLGRVQRLRPRRRGSGSADAAGVVLVPEARQPDRRRQGRHPLQPEQGQSGEGHLGSAVQSALRRDLSAQRARTVPRGCRRRQPPIRTGRSSIAIATCTRRRRPGRRITFMARRCIMERAKTAILYLWGENERLKAYNIDLATKRITGFRAEGTQFASGEHAGAWRHAGWTPGRLVQRHDAEHRGDLGRVSDARQRQLQRRAWRARRLRRHGRHQRQAEAAVSQRREPGEQHGELRQVRDAGRGERQGLRRRRSATRSSSTGL